MMQFGVLIAERQTLNWQTRRMAAEGFGFSWSLQPSLGHTFHLCSDVSGWGAGTFDYVPLGREDLEIQQYKGMRGPAQSWMGSWEG